MVDKLTPSWPMGYLGWDKIEKVIHLLNLTSRFSTSHFPLFLGSCHGLVDWESETGGFGRLPDRTGEQN